MNALAKRVRDRSARAPALAARPRMGRWALLGLITGLLLAVVWFAPARWLAAGVAAASDGRVQLDHARGSVWQGSAALTLAGGAGSHARMTLPGRLQWRIRPAWLGVDVSLLPECCSFRPALASVRLGWQRVDLRVNAPESRWPSSLLQGLGAPFNTLQLDGRFGLRVQDYELQWVQGRMLMSGTVEATLQNATSRLTTVQPMGSYRLVMHGGEPVQLELLTDSGPLLLSGHGQWQGGRFRFTGEARASSPEYLPALSNLLSLLGRRQGDRTILSL